MESDMSVPLNFPDELIIEFLLRLPVKSALRFKCVCKSWLSLISDPHFAKMHFDLAAAPSHRIMDFGSCFDEIYVDIDDDDSPVILFNTPLPLRSPERFKYLDILGSCRGFILLQIINWSNFIDFVVWNPATGVHKRIDSSFSRFNNYLRGIGYDSSIDDYVVVVITLSVRAQPSMLIDCFSLRTNSWSFTQTCTVQCHYYKDTYFCQGQFLNGALHWLALTNDSVDVIIAFDVREKKLSEILLPNYDLATGLKHQTYHLTLMGGCLSFCSVRGWGNETLVYELWTMKEYKVQSSWTKSFVYSIRYNPRFCCYIYPLCFNKNGEIFGLNFHGKLVKFIDKGELLEHGIHSKYGGPRTSIAQYGVYRESLLSLPGQV